MGGKYSWNPGCWKKWMVTVMFYCHYIIFFSMVKIWQTDDSNCAYSNWHLIHVYGIHSFYPSVVVMLTSNVFRWKKSPLCVCVCTILAALDMSHTEWLYFCNSLSTLTNTQTLTNPHIFVAHSFGKSAGLFADKNREELSCKCFQQLS